MGTQKNRLNETILLSTQNIMLQIMGKKILSILCSKILFISILTYDYTFIQEDSEKKTPNEKKDKKKKATVRSIDLPVDSKTHSYSKDEINHMMEKEVSACWSRNNICPEIFGRPKLESHILHVNDQEMPQSWTAY